jgi:thiamine pyrophosphokinase
MGSDDGTVTNVSVSFHDIIQVMEKMQRVVIVANGNLSEWIVSQIQTSDYIIGVDYAAYWLFEHRIIPDVSLGDFDSVTDKQLSIIKKHSTSVLEFSPNKDATDLELAIDHAMSLRPKEIVILGAIGTRLDHSFAAVQLMEKCIKSGVPVILRNEKNECVICNSRKTFLRNNQYKYFSLLPVTDEIIVSISGCAYPLTKKKICRGVSLGVSNEITAQEVEITVHEGLTLIVRSND